MRIGIPAETKPGERRVGLLPEHVGQLVALGHALSVTAGAGERIGIADSQYASSGAQVVDGNDAWDAELVVKVKELQANETQLLRRDATVFSFQHLAGEPLRTSEIAASGGNAIAYEMVRDADGGYPLLAPMSVMAGEMAVGIGARLLGRSPSRVLVLGAGHAGSAAAKAALDLGAGVTLLCRSETTCAAIRKRFGGRAAVAIATPAAIEAAALAADLVIGAVFIAATPTPKLLPRALVARMARGAAIVDVSIDAGGVAETSRPASHEEPSFVAEGVIHYCVPNIPAARPREATAALTAATFPYVLEMAAKGVHRAIADNPALAAGVAIWQGVPRAPLVCA